MKKTSDGQIELVLENRQLLITFLAITVICGVFFALGYVVGRNTGFESAPVAQSSSSSVNSASKPSPVSAPVVVDGESKASAGDGSAEAGGSSTDLNFYQNVEEKKPDTTLVPAEPTAATTSAQGNASERETSPAAETEYVVQVSALTRRADANALISVIKNKHLPISVATSPNDSLFHVVVGPYKNLEDAQQVKAGLEKDGFRPIIKR